MNNIDKAISQIRLASERAFDHLSGTRDPSVGTEFDAQIRRFNALLLELEDELANGIFRLEPIGMGHAIVDGWPLDSELGDLICGAENAYMLVTAAWMREAKRRKV